MSCEDCEVAQDRMFAGLDGITYYRWKNANVAVIGCRKHLKELFDFLNERV